MTGTFTPEMAQEFRLRTRQGQCRGAWRCGNAMSKTISGNLGRRPSQTKAPMNPPKLTKANVAYHIGPEIEPSPP
jgi:hypothetical protein